MVDLSINLMLSQAPIKSPQLLFELRALKLLNYSNFKRGFIYAAIKRSHYNYKTVIAGQTRNLSLNLKIEPISRTRKNNNWERPRVASIHSQ